MADLEVDVLIVGGGPVGLTASLECSRHGLTSLLVERHESTSIFPKARLVSTRTMELVRAWGLQDEVERLGLPREESLAVGVGSSLTAPDFHREVAPIVEDAPQSPTYTYICAQDKFEVVLKRTAESMPGADVRFATTMTSLTQDSDGVSAVVESAAGTFTVRAAYAVAADGARSGVRQRLGIGVEGPPPLGHMISIMFDADLVPLLHDRMCALYFLRSTIPCAVEAVDNQRRWIVQTGYDPEEGGSAADFTPEFCVHLVREAVGVPDLDVELVGIMPWLQQAVTAERFRDGRIFLAGDAAHVSTPQGGFGMNCGIQDAHNLVWKLAAVLKGLAGEGLLDTYSAERHPVGQRTVAESLDNALITFRMMEGELTMKEAIALQAGRRRSEGLVLGFHYESAAVVPDGTRPPEPDDPYRTYVATARPGHRAPHVVVSRNGTNMSTLDLMGTGFTLFTPDGSGWAKAAEEAGTRTGVHVVPIEVSPRAGGNVAVTAPRWAEVYGVSPTGAVLVRPDGHVAWRVADGTASAEVLVEVLDTVLTRTP
ncbi:FAD-dependent monooxygenase [Saccharomonospora cyanea]|uniref:2-polyprenyl-6-methoxyphenol hydroxylase-like oxidoreductase n=1 Tax=Saccharomonospora cyanea NA-134 TaxID=882082 RepID=H5XHT9_9PSEU|nr:FAD-dependent monooxygenase [Saccharomonospora cyanea]EHR62798.1 2-polyprenyl-6-methoxyphenol hydroxylase-like oxidoreductase [Saccharomonospora cyanea NA-134]